MTDQGGKAGAAGGGPLVSRAGLMEQCDNDADLLADMLELYFRGYPEVLAAIDQAVQAGAAHDLHESGHKLKGMLRYLHATRVADTAFRLGQMGATADLGGASAALAELKSQLEQLEAELQQFLPDRA